MTRVALVALAAGVLLGVLADFLAFDGGSAEGPYRRREVWVAHKVRR
jgi:hypothetical protein